MDNINSVIGFVKDIGPAVWKYVTYGTCHNDYVSKFQEMQGKLKRRLSDVGANLETQLERPRKIPKKEVEAWQEKALLVTGENVVEDLICREGFFTNIRSSRKLDEKTQELNLIFMEGENYTKTDQSLVVDDHSIKGLPQPVEKCCGRDDIQEQILEWLKGDEVTRIAVWGMGGVGKTTIMKQVHNQLLKEPKFNKIIWVKVSKDFDIIVQQKKKFDVLKFQKSIARKLGLPLKEKDGDENDLAGQILQTLQHGSYVIIVDDVWQQFRLEDVGILDLVGNNGCKLVLTTRLQDVACAMKCSVIHVKPLPNNVALSLFLDNVGGSLLSYGGYKRDIEPFLKQILQKCNGVPLAIVTVAKSMRGKLHPRLWKSALFKLSKFEGIVDSLKFSYEYLESQQCQECFLYCALYPEDYEIPKEELIEFWIEEGFIYKEGETRDVMNCEGHAILDKLVDNSLLELVKGNDDDDDDEDCVSMHDLLREMALNISPQFLVKAGMGLEKLPEEHEWREDLLKVSLMGNHIREIPSSMPSPKCTMLTTLLLSDNNISTIPEAFFEHMPGLKILDLSDNDSLDSLPSSISKLKNLTTLLLKGCESLTEVPSLSNLKGLKKLDLSKTSIGELPQDLNMLTNLKYLKFVGERLSGIPDGQLQNLSKLQHLEVDFSITLKGEEIRGLEKLELFQGRFSTVHDMSILVNSRREFLNMYSLFIGSYLQDPDLKFKDWLGFLTDVESKSIACFEIDICGKPNWLPSNVQRLSIFNCNAVRSLNDIFGFQDATDLRSIKIESCDGMEFVLSWPWLNSLQNLEELYLSNLSSLNAVFEVEAVAKSVTLPAGTFSSLKEISVSECDEIEKLFPVSCLGNLQNLQTIIVSKCNQMKEIIWSKHEGGEEALLKVTLPKLERLELTNLPQLNSIYGGPGTVWICDSIKMIEIRSCPEIDTVFGSGLNPFPTLEYLHLDLENLKSVFDERALGLSPPPPTTPTIHFPLRTIRVYNCHQLKKVFSSGWLLNCFQSLETIDVYDCKQMKEVISSSAYEEEKVTLPNLQSLELKYLPALKSICSSSTVLSCDSIKNIEIDHCPEIDSVFGSGFNPFPTLECLHLDLENLKSVFDERALGLSPPPRTTPAIHFPLKIIIVYNCHQLKKVFSSGWLLNCFQSLENILVAGCKQMKEVILSSAYEKVTLPNLRGLYLMNLPVLKSICSSSTVLFCDSIKKIEISDCPEIESVFWSGFNSFPTLEHLLLQNLKNMKFVFDEEALGSSPRHTITLPKLQRLGLINLPALKSIYSGSNNVLNCESIELLKIICCEKLKRIPLNFGLLDNAQSSHPPSLKKIVVFPKELWESFEWEYPDAILLPFCKFEDKTYWW